MRLVVIELLILWWWSTTSSGSPDVKFRINGSVFANNLQNTQSCSYCYYRCYLFVSFYNNLEDLDFRRSLYSLASLWLESRRGQTPNPSQYPGYGTELLFTLGLSRTVVCMFLKKKIHSTLKWCTLFKIHQERERGRERERERDRARERDRVDHCSWAVKHFNTPVIFPCIHPWWKNRTCLQSRSAGVAKNYFNCSWASRNWWLMMSVKCFIQFSTLEIGSLLKTPQFSSWEHGDPQYNPKQPQTSPREAIYIEQTYYAIQKISWSRIDET